MVAGLVRIFFLRLIYFSGIWALFRIFNRRKIRIVMYHGVCEQDELIWTQVPLEKFREQISYFARSHRVIEMEEAVARLKNGSSCPDSPLVITFDDGFKNNKTLAYYQLKAHGLPAAIFLTTSFIDKSSRFRGLIRTDYIIGLFRNAGVERVDLSDQGLGVLEFKSPKERVDAAYKVGNAIKRINHLDENRIIDILTERLGGGLSEHDMSILTGMTWDDARELQEDGLVSFGAHTVSHEILSMLPSRVMVSEVIDSKAEIERRLGEKVRFFAYPNGTILDFNEDVKKTVAGHFDCALTSIRGLNSAGADLYTLRRIGIGNDTELWRLKLELSGIIDFLLDAKSVIFGSKEQASVYDSY